jgi:hypothetical protein
MGYSDSNQAIQLTDPRKDGRVFTVGIYDNVAYALMSLRFIVKNGTLYMNACRDSGEENDFSTLMGKHPDIKNVTVKGIKPEGKWDTHPETFYEAYPVARLFIDAETYEDNSYVVGYYILSLDQYVDTHGALTREKFASEKFFAPAPYIRQDSYDIWDVYDKAGDIVGTIEKCDMPGVTAKYAGNLLCTWRTSYGMQSDRWHNALVNAPTLAECADVILREASSKS